MDRLDLAYEDKRDRFSRVSVGVNPFIVRQIKLVTFKRITLKACAKIYVFMN